MKEKQLELNLYDDLLHADALVKYLEAKNFGNTRLHLFGNYRRNSDGTKTELSYTLGTRTPGYETDYTHDFKINLEQAVYLYKKGVRTHSDEIIKAAKQA